MNLHSIVPRFLGVLVLVTAVTRSSEAATWYFTPAGAGSNNGTSASNAWPAAQFNSSSHWSATAGSTTSISPGDTVIVQGSVTSPLNCAGSGLQGNIITVSFAPGSTCNQFSFNGKDYIRMTGFHLPDNYDTGSLTPAVSFGNPFSGISKYCVVDHMYSSGKTGSAFVDFGNCAYVTVSDCTFVDFTGHGFTAGNSVDQITIKNNLVQTSLGPITSQTDLLHLGWATNVLIQGNRLISRGSAAAGNTTPPHNDIMQCYWKTDDHTQRPADWTIANNWFEIDGPQNGKGYNNFGMLQNVKGTFTFCGNVFYSHDMSSSVGNGIDFQYYDATIPVTAKFYNNTFVSLRTGLTYAIQAFPSQPNADRHRLEIINNIFYRDATDNSPIHQGFSSEPNGVFIMKNNLISGWGSAVENVNSQGNTHISSTGFNTSWGLGGRQATASEIGFLATARNAENFLVNSASLARQNGAPLATALTLPQVQNEAAFPNPVSAQTGTVVDIGAGMGGLSSLSPPTNLQIVP